jgi:ribonuclease T2
VRFVAALTLIAASGCSDSNEAAPPTPIAIPAGKPTPVSTSERGKGFDFYVLSLSWSPSYCEAEGEDANRQQCASGRPYAFVVHGLWPQFERGFPQDCATDRTDVPRDVISRTLPIMPSTGLIRHQWRKHGSCAGLSQGDYFDVLQAARTRIAIPAEFARLKTYLTVAPDAVEKAFVAANAGMKPDGIGVSCDRRFLREVRICMTRGLEFRSCPEIDRRGCNLSKAVMPPVRGG